MSDIPALFDILALIEAVKQEADADVVDEIVRTMVASLYGREFKAADLMAALAVVLAQLNRDGCSPNAKNSAIASIAVEIVTADKRKEDAKS